LNSLLYIKEKIVDNKPVLFGFDKSAGKNYKTLLGQEKIGFDWSEMVMGCYFMNSNCKTVYEEVFSPKYGRCYTSKDSGQICNIELFLI